MTTTTTTTRMTIMTQYQYQQRNIHLKHSILSPFNKDSDIFPNGHEF